MEFPRRQIRPRDCNHHQNLHPLMKVSRNLHHMKIHKGVRPIGQWYEAGSDCSELQKEIAHILTLGLALTENRSAELFTPISESPDI